MKLLSKTAIAAVTFLSALSLGSCKPDTSKPPIKKKQMVSLLVDVHIAQAVVARQSSIPYEKLDRNAVYKSVLDKHGVTEAQFDSAVSWYARHAVDYKQVYKAVNDTMQKRRLMY